MDVTEHFKSAAEQLPPGQLIKDQYFTLFEAVGALEIMDPKMDSGVIPDGDTFEPTFDVCRGLDPDELIWILDELIMLEMAWHDGFPLSQTVFMSLHIDRLLEPENRAPYTFLHGNASIPVVNEPYHLTHIVLRAYCVAVVKCCQATLRLIQSQSFYEEEDFVTHLFGRELLPRVDVTFAHGMLKDALSCLGGMRTLSTGLRAAIEARLDFRISYLAALNGNTQSWLAMLHHLDVINETHSLGNSLADAFSEKVQRRLATSTPPRPMLQLSWSAAFADIKEMCESVIEANRLVNPWVCQSPYSLQRAIWALAYRKPAPKTFARAYLQDLLFGDERLTENMTHFDLFLCDIRDLVLAGDPLADVNSFQVELPTSSQYLCSRQIEAFMEKGFDEYLNLYRMVCQNRCRTRRTFTQAVGILDSLQSEARRTDDAIHAIVSPTMLQSRGGVLVPLRPLETWAKYHRLRIIIWTIQLGFETEIYLPNELAMMHWYLSELSQELCDLLIHIEHFLLERMGRVTKQRQTQYAAECLASHDWIKSLRGYYDATTSIAKALWKLYSTLDTGKAVQAAQATHNRLDLLFEARMKIYLGPSNEPTIRLEDFHRAQQSLSPVAATCEDIQVDLKTAKMALASIKELSPQQGKYIGTEVEWKKELKQLETTCVAVAVQSSKLSRLPPNEPASSHVDLTIPIPEKRYHIWWIVPDIKEQK